MRKVAPHLRHMICHSPQITRGCCTVRHTYPGKRVLRYRFHETHFPGKPYPSNSVAASKAIYNRNTRRGPYRPGVIVEGVARPKR